MKYYYNKDILNYIDSLLIKEQHVRLTILNDKDIPLKSISGLATGGSISVNAKSTVRRTGSVSLVSVANNPDDAVAHVTDIENLISINKRVKVEIGLRNTDNQYLDYDYFWFNQGVFVIKSASVSSNAQNISISVSISDKMSLLNGDCGGRFTSALIHSPIAVENGDEEPVLFTTLIHELVSEMGGIPEDKIMIEDIEDEFKAVVRWTGSGNIFMVNTSRNRYKLTSIPREGALLFKSQESLGYKKEKFTYPGTLESKAGETVTSVLDKIKNALGNYEYYFDEDGIFHFKEIKNYLNEGSSIDDLNEAINEKYLKNLSNGKVEYSFENNALITSYSNSPQYANIKNDIIIWGKAEDKQAPVRYHLIIDTPPEERDWFTIDDVEIDYLGNIKAKRVTRHSANDKPESAIKASNWQQQYYLSIVADNIQTNLAKEFKEEFPKIFDIGFNGATANGKTGWKYTLSSSSIKYFLDMLDPKSLVGDNVIKDMSIEKIGQRNTVINDNAVNCVFEPKFDEVLFINADDITPVDKKYIVLTDDIKDYISIGVAQVSAYETVRSALHTYTSYANAISLQTIPVYHLKPNSRIYIKDDNSDINGEFMINSITIPLDAGGMMNISASKADERI